MDRKGRKRAHISGRRPEVRDLSVDESVEREIAAHLAYRTEQLISEGMTPEAARTEAERLFGDRDRISRWCREVAARGDRQKRLTAFIQNLMLDSTYALRTLYRRPQFTLTAILTLGLGIGAVTAMYSVTQGVLLSGLPYEQSGELVAIWETFPHWQGQEVLEDLWDKVGLSWPEYLRFRQESQTFQAVTAFRQRDMFLTGADRSRSVVVGEASPSLFDVLGVQPPLGRTFLPGEEGPGAERLTILSHELWVSSFGSDPGIIGTSITLDGMPFEVIGILPQGFRLRSTHYNLIKSALDEGTRPLWVPLAFDGRSTRARQNTMEVIGRLAPDTTIEQARAETDALLRAGRPESELDFRLVPLKDNIVRNYRTPLLLLLSAAGLLLLIACGNIAALFMGEAMNRRHEMATRAALGAGQPRIIRQLLTESIILGLAGSVAGIIIASIGISALLSLSPPLPRLEEVGMHTGVLFVAVITGMLTGILFGLAPAFSSARASIGTLLRTVGLGVARAGARFQRTVVTFEIALTVILLVTYGLFFRSLQALSNIDPGFNPENLATVRISFSAPGFPRSGSQQEFLDEVIRNFEAIPGATAVSGTDGLPYPGQISGTLISIEGRSNEDGGQLSARQRWILPGYHEVMEIPVLAGRTFTTADIRTSIPVMIINESLVRRYWPDSSPLGSRITYGRTTYTVIGIVGDIRERHLSEEPQAMFYLPFLRDTFRDLSLVVRTTGDPAEIVSQLSEAVWSIDRDAPVAQMSTVTDLMAASTNSERYRTLLALIFGVSAAVLAAVGIFGVTARSIANRTREMGVHLALGARVADLVVMTLRSTLLTSVFGTLIGLIGVYWTSQLLNTLLFGTKTRDPLVLTGVVLLVLTMSLSAGYLSTLRIGRINPVEVLKEE